MKSERISYAELAKHVGDVILFNNHSELNNEWFYGLIEQPLMTKRLEEIDAENRQYAVDRINASTDEAEKAKLTEELAENDENGERATVTDFEIYQTYHITQRGAEYLFNHTAELISYDEKLDAYLWHIGHYGTSWTHVHTEVYTFDDELEHEYVWADKFSKFTAC